MSAATELDTSPAARDILTRWLSDYSAEVTTPDRKSLDVAAELMWPQAPVYIASLPKDDSAKQLEVAVRLKQLGLRPVPHIVARNLPSEAAFAHAVERFAQDAGVDRALILAGDRDDSVGPYQSSIELIRSGILEANGITRIAIACYPEGHPRIADEVLDRALIEKVAAAESAGVDCRLITQLCFDGQTIAQFVKRLRKEGIANSLRIGLAGPAKPTTLLKYAAICGVGPSLRALRESSARTKGLLSTQTPAAIVADLAEAMLDDPSLDITGLHFFTFASLRSTISWASDELTRHEEPGA